MGFPTLLIVGSALHQRLNLDVTIVIFGFFDMSDLVGGTDSHVDSDESTTTSTDFDHERLPPPGAPGPVADAASRHQEHTIFAKRTLGVSQSPSASTATPSGRRHDKRQKTTAAREDLCCFCSPLATCSPRSCSCAKAGRPCRCCEPGNCGRCANTVAAHNRVIRQENYRRQSGIGARFRQRVGRPLDPPIPLYPVPVPPLPDADDDDIDARGEQNNPSGGTADDDDDDVAFFDALAALPAADDPVAAANIDASSNAYLGPSADADDLDPVSDPTGLLADGFGAPSAPDASLGFPADWSITPGNNDVSGMGPDDVDGDVADPGDGASGDRPLGLLTGGDVSPRASLGGTNGSASGDAPSAADASSLGLSARWSTSQGDDGISGEGPDDVDGDVANPVGDGASGDRPPDPSIGGNVNPLASRGGTNGSAGVDAPSAADAPLGLSAGLSTSQGDDDVAGMGPDDVDGDVADPGDGASGDSTLGHSAGENVGPPASPGGTNGSADGRDAPSTISMNVGPAANRHGTTEEDVGSANAGLPDANVTPAGRSARLYPLFNGRSAGSGWRIASAGRGVTAQRVSLSPAAADQSLKFLSH